MPRVLDCEWNVVSDLFIDYISRSSMMNVHGRHRSSPRTLFCSGQCEYGTPNPKSQVGGSSKSRPNTRRRSRASACYFCPGWLVSRQSDILGWYECWRANASSNTASRFFRTSGSLTSALQMQLRDTSDDPAASRPMIGGLDPSIGCGCLARQATGWLLKSLDENCIQVSTVRFMSNDQATYKMHFPSLSRI